MDCARRGCAASAAVGWVLHTAARAIAIVGPLWAGSHGRGSGCVLLIRQPHKAQRCTAWFGLRHEVGMTHAMVHGACSCTLRCTLHVSCCALHVARCMLCVARCMSHAARVKYAAHRLYDRQRTPPIPCNAQNTVEWPPTCSSCLGQASPPSPHRSSRPLHGNSAATYISNSREDCRGRGPMVVCEEP